MSPNQREVILTLSALHSLLHHHIVIQTGLNGYWIRVPPITSVPEERCLLVLKINGVMMSFGDGHTCHVAGRGSSYQVV